ncbi:catalase HPII [Niabella ginsenosidivorans]|uniref:Catalase n=1 Tax=Niabella ginsenosidivorans TaxID=1176587 RepID=A0A1A9IAK1_9BACT|nr:catalase [Niabella ginsenosidivorans]ANH83780.1 catalase HPII [Niabella ginsenosidivorans]
MAKRSSKKDLKTADLQSYTTDAANQFMTTDQGLKMNDDHNSLKAGDRGGTLLEDIILREKITHFDHERIPERIVHARGSGAHGVFRLTKSLKQYTKAAFLTDTTQETPVFVRFSTVAGSRGSTDLARDVRGFAVKFYTTEGNYDLVGNNIPVFFIQDAMKFPDLVHAVKPEPDNEIPQAASAHDTFWDFISLMPESTHMILWVMSDRAIPRSLRMMEGFGVHTFRLINEKGAACFVKFHWKPVLGVHSVAWDEAQKISGKDSDFHRRDLWEAIEEGRFPEWDLGVQIIPEKEEHRFEFDLLDPTKLVPEELVPVQIIGRMTLNRNPDNFFAETEQVMFSPAHLVPGIDFSNDPLLQGRLFSYTDTQLSRLGGPNFHQIPVNRSVNTIYNNQRDGHMQMQINKGKAAYSPNSIGGGCPFLSREAEGGFTSYAERIDARKIRGRSKSFLDHFSQAILFYNSQSAPEQQHIKDAFSFELSRVTIPEIRQRMVNTLTNVNRELAQYVASRLGLPVPKKVMPVTNGAIPADGLPKDYNPVKKNPPVKKSAALSMAQVKSGTIATRCIAVLAADGTDAAMVMELKKKAGAKGAKIKVIAPRLGALKASDHSIINADETLFNTASVLFDAVYIPGGAKAIEALLAEPDAIHFVNEQFRHCKAIGAAPDAAPFIQNTFVKEGAGISLNGNVDRFLKDLGLHRFWEREMERKVPA